MRRSSLRTVSVVLGGSALAGLLAVAEAGAQDAAPLMLGAPMAAQPAARPVMRAPVAAAVVPKPTPKPTTTAKAPLPQAKTAALTTGSVPQKPKKPAKTAAAKPKSADPGLPPAARRAAMIAAMTAQAVPPAHAHVFKTVAPNSCPNNPDAIGVSRVMEVDTKGGFYVGQTYHTRLPLEPKEVVLTFDDGPMGGRTDRVLAALDHDCVKATFFIVGQMAKAYPQTLRKTAAAGHTIGYHTMTHPLGMVKWPLPKAQDNIREGWQTVDQILYGQAGDHPATPFFRYPGLFNSRAINEWFNGLDMGVFAIDAAGNDWLKGYITLNDGPNVMNRALSELEARQGGILLLHDIKDSSSSIVAPLLKELKARGFKIVHLVPKNPPPPLTTGPVTAVLPTIAESTAPLEQRGIDGFDATKQLAQEIAGRSGASAAAPLPTYEQARPRLALATPAATTAQPLVTGSTLPAAATSPAPLASTMPTTTTARVVPVSTAAATPVAAKSEDGWFSSTASTFRNLGLW